MKENIYMTPKPSIYKYKLRFYMITRNLKNIKTRLKESINKLKGRLKIK